MKRLIATTMLSLALMAAGCSLSAQKRLTILHTNDTHSHIDPERGKELAGRGGVIERAACIDSVRKADGAKNVLLLDAGDFDQGSSYFTILNGDLEADLLNAMGYDAVALGNHEFDNGLDELARRCGNIKAEVVCANYDFSAFELGKYVKPYAIFKRGGLKIGVIGLLCDVRSVVSSETASKLSFGDPAEAVKQWTPWLREKKGCDLIVVLSHLGYIADCKLAEEVSGVDLVIGGHSHTRLSEAKTVEAPDGGVVTVVQDHCWGLSLGELHISR